MTANRRLALGWRGLWVWTALVGWGLIGAGAAWGQDAATDFRNNCVSCHTVGGGRLVGPDLKDVTQRRDRQWLLKFLGDPKAMVDSGDPVAQQLAKEAGGVIMPTLPLGKARFDALIDLLESESKLPRSKFAGQVVSDRLLGPADVAAGEGLFLGRTALSGGGPACFSCHAVEGIGGLGGGSLGPDLTKVFERLGGRKGLTGWLAVGGERRRIEGMAGRAELRGSNVFTEGGCVTGVTPHRHRKRVPVRAENGALATDFEPARIMRFVARCDRQNLVADRAGNAIPCRRGSVLVQVQVGQ